MADAPPNNWERRRDSGSSNWSNGSSIPASINQRPRMPQDNYGAAPISTTGMVHRNPFQNPSPAPSIYESQTSLQPPNLPFSASNGRPTSSGGLSIASQSSSKVNLADAGSLSITYIPSKFSRPLSPGVSYRKANKSGPDGLVKRGGGREAFANGASRMPGAGDDDYDGLHSGSKVGKLRWNRFKWIIFFTNTVVRYLFSPFLPSPHTHSLYPSSAPPIA